MHAFPDEYQTLLDKKVCRQFCQHTKKVLRKVAFFLSSTCFISEKSRYEIKWTSISKKGFTICQINWARTHIEGAKLELKADKC